VRRTLWLASLMLLVALPALAEVRRLEVVGVVPAGPDAPPGVPIRQAALEAALAEAVMRVASERLSPESVAAPDLDLAKVLGGNPREFTVGYRVLEDRGERRALLVADPEVATEYALQVEVDVDVSRVESALAAAGLPIAEPVEGSSHEVRVVVEHLPSYRAYAALRSHLMEAGGASSVIPERFEQGKVELRVAGRLAPDELIDRLVAPAPEGLRVEPVFADTMSVWIRVTELPPALRD
jgi:hypothetical protein